MEVRFMSTSTEQKVIGIAIFPDELGDENCLPQQFLFELNEVKTDGDDAFIKRRMRLAELILNLPTNCGTIDDDLLRHLDESFNDSERNYIFYYRSYYLPNDIYIKTNHTKKGYLHLSIEIVNASRPWHVSTSHGVERLAYKD